MDNSLAVLNMIAAGLDSSPPVYENPLRGPRYSPLEQEEHKKLRAERKKERQRKRDQRRKQR